MKRKMIMIASVAFIVLLLAGCGEVSRQNVPVDIPPSAFVDRMFAAEGNIYAIRSAGGYSYITTEFSNDPVCYQISKLLNGRYSDAIWHEQSGRLYYSDGYRVYSCDLTGNDKIAIWELPDGSKKDFVSIAAVADDCLLIEGGYGERKPAEHSISGDYMYRTRTYFSVNVKTGEAVSVLSEVPYYKMPNVLCSHGSSVLAVQLTDRDGYAPILENETQGEETARVVSIELLSGEVKELGFFTTVGTISHADGVVSDDKLYFMCERVGIYSMPLSEGEIERVRLDTTQVPGMDQFIGISQYNEKAYVLMWDGVTYPSSALCEWDMEKNILLPMATTDDTFTPMGFYIDSDTYFLFAGEEIISGGLSGNS